MTKLSSQDEIQKKKSDDVAHVIGVLFASKLDEPIALVQIRDPVLWHVHINCSNQQQHDTYLRLRSRTCITQQRNEILITTTRADNHIDN